VKTATLQAALGEISGKTILGKTIITVILQGSCEDSGTAQVSHQIRLIDVSKKHFHEGR